MAGIYIIPDKYISKKSIHKLILKKQTERALAQLKAQSDAKGGLNDGIAEGSV
ncbi:MAG: hypothetical protein PHR24_01715 [Oscillospiraceae bacterium]|nr:hypothetical protein [Oscillospiraceae bacterium]MDD4545996.1 hypothetical protein [Oscillospiraceae bacterium]